MDLRRGDEGLETAEPEKDRRKDRVTKRENGETGEGGGGWKRNTSKEVAQLARRM